MDEVTEEKKLQNDEIPSATTTFAYYFSEPGASAHGQDESYLLDAGREIFCA